jgi:hypothetical protein
MAYEEISDIETVTLGGINKNTNEPNPTELEGYLVGKEQRPNKFNPGTPQNYYIFKTQYGLQGIYAKAGINSALKNAVMGRMTKLVATGETLDTGKGFPMKVFKAAQDKTNTIEVDLIPAYANAVDSDDSDDVGNWTPPVAAKTTAPTLKAPLSTVAASSNKAQIEALLKSRR